MVGFWNLGLEVISSDRPRSSVGPPVEFGQKISPKNATSLLFAKQLATKKNIIPAKHPNSCFNTSPVRTVRTDRPFFIGFFNDSGWVGLEHVDFPLVVQWFLDCFLSRRVIRLRSWPPATRPRGGFMDPFYHLKNPLAKRY